MRLFCLLLLLFISLSSLSLAQKEKEELLDPLEDLCQLTGHSVAELDNTLYTLGGTALYTVSGKDAFPNATILSGNQAVISVPNQYLRILPLTSNSTGSAILLPSTLSLDTNPPLWMHNHQIYVSAANNTEIWVYTPPLSTWSQIPSIQGTGPTRGTGSWAAVPDNSTASLYALSSAGDGLDYYNTVDAEWTRNDGPGDNKAGELLVHFPAIGILVSLLPSQSTSSSSSSSSSSTDVSIYDVAADTWYTQSTTSAPSPSSILTPSACAIAASAPDGSSHNIYIFSSNTLYILSLPSFTWIRVGDTNFGLTDMACTAVASRWMVVYQGATDSRECRGARGAELLDLSSMKWGELMDPEKAVYSVPTSVQAVIGGNGQGGAEVHTPENGFQDVAVAALFSAKKNSTTTDDDDNDPNKNSSSSSTAGTTTGSATSGRKLSTATIVAIVFAAVIGAALLVFAVRRAIRLCCLESGLTEKGKGTSPQELDAGHTGYWSVWGLSGVERRSQAPDAWMLKWLHTERWRTQEGVAELQGDDLSRV